MSKSTLNIDAQLLDELACGSLRGERYRQAIRSLEAHPERWRDCALAFLQEQALTQELQDIAAGEPQWGADELTDSKESFAVESAARTEAEDRREYSRLQWMHRLTSLAALLLISFTVGWFGAGMTNSNSTGRGGVAQEGGSSVGPGAEQLVDSLPRAEVPGAGGQVLTGPMERLGNDLRLSDGSFFTVGQEMPDRLREMERRGLVRIESYEVYMPMDLPDGSSAVVPIQQYRVKPAVYSY